MEYPPGALAVFLPPAVFGSGALQRRVQAADGAVRSGDARAGRRCCSCASVRRRRGCGSPCCSWRFRRLALGPISLNTYDAWPALLTRRRARAVARRAGVAAFALLGLAFAAKVYPLVLVPPALVFVWRTAGRDAALRAALASSSRGRGGHRPVPRARARTVSLRASAPRRHVRCRSRVSAARSSRSADRLGVYSATVVHRTGHAISYDLVGLLPEALGVRELGLTGARRRARSPGSTRGVATSRARLAVAFAAAVAGFLAFTRFFSPQYLVWLVPFVVLLEPAVWAMTAAALVLAQIWFFHYCDVFALGGYVWLVLLRDLVVLALFAVSALVATPARGGRRGSRPARTRAATPGFVVAQQLHRRRQRRVAVRVAGLRLVGGDPRRVLEEREAEHAAARGQVCAERVRRADDGVVGDELQRACRRSRSWSVTRAAVAWKLLSAGNVTPAGNRPEVVVRRRAPQARRPSRPESRPARAARFAPKTAAMTSGGISPAV